MEKPSLKSIAANIGVSERLVAYALNGTGRVGSDTRLRIVEEAERLGYRANRAAKTLATGRSGLVALCLPKMATAYGDAITWIVEALARKAEFDLVVTRMSDGDASLIPAGLAQVDGALLLEPPCLPSDSEMAIVGNVVVIGVCNVDGLDRFDHVTIDMHEAARSAVDTLLAKSPKRFAYMTAADINLTVNATRYQAYIEGVTRAGLDPVVIRLDRNTDLMSDAASVLLKYATNFDCPDAIMCSNDEIAIGVFRALRELGLHVPENVVVTGCDGIAMAQDVCPPLSTITQPFEDMLEQAWEFFMRRMHERDLPVQSAVYPATFTARRSTGGG